MSDITLSAAQQAAIDKILKWSEDPSSPRFTLGGFAGTGKTTLIHVLQEAFGSVCVCPTGKACAVLKSKLPKGADVRTVHGLLYIPDPPCPQRVRALQEQLALDPDNKELAERVKKETKRVDDNDIRWIDRMDVSEGFVIVDESSMVSPKMQLDLERVASKILYVGDPGQLPPVLKGQETKGVKGDFFERNGCDVMLTEIHRQAEGSPILMLATAIRSGDGSFHGWGDDCRRIDLLQVTPELLLGVDQIITGKNVTRRMLNRTMRRDRFEGTFPREGERVICLHNDWKLGFINGVQGDVLKDAEVDGNRGRLMDVRYEEEDRRNIRIDEHAFKQYDDPELKKPWNEIGLPTTQWDFGYAITVHKSQGSEWPSVLIYDDEMQKRNKEFRRKWLYTAVTRASQKLIWARRMR